MAGWCLLSESPSCVHLQSVIRQENPSLHHYLAVNIPDENWFGFIGFDAGWRDGVCCFHIAVAMIYSNDFCVSEFSHKKYLRFRID